MEVYIFIVLIFMAGIAVGFFIRSKSYEEVRQFRGVYQPTKNNLDKSDPPNEGSGVPHV